MAASEGAAAVGASPSPVPGVAHALPSAHTRSHVHTIVREAVAREFDRLDLLYEWNSAPAAWASARDALAGSEAQRHPLAPTLTQREQAREQLEQEAMYSLHSSFVDNSDPLFISQLHVALATAALDSETLVREHFARVHTHTDTHVQGATSADAGQSRADEFNVPNALVRISVAAIAAAFPFHSSQAVSMGLDVLEGEAHGARTRLRACLAAVEHTTGAGAETHVETALQPYMWPSAPQSQLSDVCALVCRVVPASDARVAALLAACACVCEGACTCDSATAAAALPSRTRSAKLRPRPVSSPGVPAPGVAVPSLDLDDAAARVARPRSRGPMLTRIQSTSSPTTPRVFGRSISGDALRAGVPAQRPTSAQVLADRSLQLEPIRARPKLDESARESPLRAQDAPVPSPVPATTAAPTAPHKLTSTATPTAQEAAQPTAEPSTVTPDDDGFVVRSPHTAVGLRPGNVLLHREPSLAGSLSLSLINSPTPATVSPHSVVSTAALKRSPDVYQAAGAPPDAVSQAQSLVDARGSIFALTSLGAARTAAASPSHPPSHTSRALVCVHVNAGIIQRALRRALVRKRSMRADLPVRTRLAQSTLHPRIRELAIAMLQRFARCATARARAKYLRKLRRLRLQRRYRKERRADEHARALCYSASECTRDLDARLQALYTFQQRREAELAAAARAKAEAQGRAAFNRVMAKTASSEWIKVNTVKDGETVQSFVNIKTAVRQTQHPNLRLAEHARGEADRKVRASFAHALGALTTDISAAATRSRARADEARAAQDVMREVRTFVAAKLGLADPFAEIPPPSGAIVTAPSSGSKYTRTPTSPTSPLQLQTHIAARVTAIATAIDTPPKF